MMVSVARPVREDTSEGVWETRKVEEEGIIGSDTSVSGFDGKFWRIVSNESAV
jgi:hypothetical protein